MKAVKKKQVKQIPQEIVGPKSDDELAFEKVKHLIFLSLGMKRFKEDINIRAYQRLIMHTSRHKNPDEKKRYIDLNMKPYRGMLDKFGDQIIESDLTWLTSANIEVQSGKSGNARFPLSKVYEQALKSGDDLIDTMEGYLFIIFKFLSPKESELREKLTEICSDFEDDKPETSDAGQQALKNMTSKIQKRMQGMENQPNEDQLMGIIKDIAGGAVNGDGSEGGGIQDLVASMMSGKMGVPDLIKSITETVEQNKASGSE